MAIIKTKNLSFRYPQSSENVLKNINIEIASGELVLLMGKTGSGKSTFLRLLKSELAPKGEQSGIVEDNSESTAFVIQTPELSFVAHKVRGELAFALENKRYSSDKIALRIGEISSYFNITELLDSTVDELSGGEKAVVSVAAAMIDNADVLIMDEPFSQLDPKAAAELLSLVKRINQELGVTVIISCHSCEGLVDICDRMIVLDNGTVIQNSSPQNAVKNDKLLGFFPIYTALFDKRPLSVKDAVSLSVSLLEREYIPDDNKEIILQAKSISFAYGRRQKDILSSLDLSVAKGSIHSIIGSNGSGKSTLLKAIAGINKCYSGRIKANGKIAYMPQDVRYLFTKDTVSEEISPDTAEKFGLSSFLSRHPYDLSGGQMQMLALAMLSEQSYDILLLDEAARGLDFNAKNELKKYLKSITAQGKTVVFVSHDMDFVSEISDEISFLSDGIITITGDRRTVLSSLDFYTSTVRRITRKHLKNAVSKGDLL